MKLRRRFFFAFLLVAVCSAHADEKQPVTVKRNPPKIVRNVFDPNRPPTAMPKVMPSELGVCYSEFTCNVGIGVFIDQLSPTSVEIKVDSVDMILDLSIDIWTQKEAPPKLARHEEGHREISEYYYKDAEAIARRLGKAMIGRKATATGKDKASAAEAAQNELLTELKLAYMKETRVRCSACQVRYDAITTHGLKPISEAEAIAQAIAEEPPRSVATAPASAPASSSSPAAAAAKK